MTVWRLFFIAFGALFVSSCVNFDRLDISTSANGSGQARFQFSDRANLDEKNTATPKGFSSDLVKLRQRLDDCNVESRSYVTDEVAFLDASEGFESVADLNSALQCGKDLWLEANVVSSFHSGIFSDQWTLDLSLDLDRSATVDQCDFLDKVPTVLQVEVPGKLEDASWIGAVKYADFKAEIAGTNTAIFELIRFEEECEAKYKSSQVAIEQPINIVFKLTSYSWNYDAMAIAIAVLGVLITTAVSWRRRTDLA